MMREWARHIEDLTPRTDVHNSYVHNGNACRDLQGCDLVIGDLLKVLDQSTQAISVGNLTGSARKLGKGAGRR